MGKPYFILVGRDMLPGGPLELIAGDYSRKVMQQEREDNVHSYRSMRIIRLPSDGQAGIDAKMAELNARGVI